MIAQGNSTWAMRQHITHPGNLVALTLVERCCGIGRGVAVPFAQVGQFARKSAREPAHPPPGLIEPGCLRLKAVLCRGDKQREFGCDIGGFLPEFAP